MDTQLGNILRNYRKQRNITLQDLANKTGLSTAYLSLLERNNTSPTIKNLNVICQALDTTMASLIEEMDHAEYTLTKKDEREMILDEPGFSYELATKGNTGMKCVIMTVHDEKLHISSPHVVDEIGYILNGSLCVTVNGITYDMNPGDCVYVRAQQQHSYQNTGSEPCVSLWVYGSLPNPYAENEIKPQITTK